MTLARLASGILVGQVALAASQWALVIALARDANPQAVGSFVVALAITAPLINAVTLNQRAVLAAGSAPRFTLGDHLRLRTVMLSLGLVVLAAITLSGAIGATTVLTVVFVGLARMAWGVSDLLYGPFLGHRRTGLITASMIARAVLGLVGGLAGLHFQGSVVGAAMGLAVGWALPIVLVDVPGTRWLRRRHRDPDGRWPPSLSLKRQGTGHTLSLFKLTLPLGLVALLVSVHANLPRYIVAHQLDVAHLGYFAALTSLLVPGTLAASALSQAALPRLGTLNAARPRHFLRLVASLCGLMVALGAVGLVLATWFERPIMTLVYGAEYAGRTTVLQWLVVAAIFSFVGTVLDAALTSATRFRAQAVASLAGALVLLPTAWWLVGVSGLVGVAQAVALGALTATVVRVVALLAAQRAARADAEARGGAHHAA